MTYGEPSVSDVDDAQAHGPVTDHLRQVVRRVVVCRRKTPAVEPRAVAADPLCGKIVRRFGNRFPAFQVESSRECNFEHAD